MLGRWRQLWGQAGTEKVWEFERIELQGAAQGMRAQGFVSLTAAHSKGNQFICEDQSSSLEVLSLKVCPSVVNSRPLAPSPLHKLVNDRFSQSSFSRHAASHLVAPLSTSPSKRVASPTVTKASRKSPKKSAERFPIFVLNLVAPPGMVDVTLEPEKRVVEFEVRHLSLRLRGPANPVSAVGQKPSPRLRADHHRRIPPPTRLHVDACSSPTARGLTFSRFGFLQPTTSSLAEPQSRINACGRRTACEATATAQPRRSR